MNFLMLFYIFIIGVIVNHIENDKLAVAILFIVCCWDEIEIAGNLKKKEKEERKFLFFKE